MDERKIQEAIQRGRDFLKSQDTAELERNGSDYKTDQELKKPQPPLVKAPMTENRIPGILRACPWRTTCTSCWQSARAAASTPRRT